MNQFIIFDPAGAGIRSTGGTLLSVDMIGGPAILDFDGLGDEVISIPLTTGNKTFMSVDYGGGNAAIAAAALETINNAVYRGIPGVGTIPVIGEVQNLEYTEA